MSTCIMVAAARGVSPARVALAWMLSILFVTAPIISATKIEHLEDVIAAVAWELTDHEIKLLEAPYQPHPVRRF
jgi:aryl-alcohol dehydrogenase-like predicted oxidoreductase